MKIVPLRTRALIILSGKDVIPFLQGLISNDARKLEKGEPVYAALLTPQGKFLHDLFLVSWRDFIWMDCERSREADLRHRLTQYKLRSQIVIEPAPPSMGIFALWDGAPPASPDSMAYADPRLPELGYRVIAGESAFANQPMAAFEDYDAMRLSHGVPDGSRDLIVEKSLLLDWGMDALHGVDFTKGCYVGQEVTARMHYRAERKKAAYIVRAEAEDQLLPAAGEAVYCGEAPAGELRSSLGRQGLAILRIEEVEKSQQSGMPLRVGDVVIEARLPGWRVPT